MDVHDNGRPLALACRDALLNTIGRDETRRRFHIRERRKLVWHDRKEILESVHPKLDLSSTAKHHEAVAVKDANGLVSGRRRDDSITGSRRDVDERHGQGVAIQRNRKTTLEVTLADPGALKNEESLPIVPIDLLLHAWALDGNGPFARNRERQRDRLDRTPDNREPDLNEDGEFGTASLDVRDTLVDTTRGTLFESQREWSGSLAPNSISFDRRHEEPGIQLSLLELVRLERSPTLE